MDKRTTRYLKEKAILDAERQSIRLKEDPALILYDNGRLFDEKTNKFCKISLNKKKGKVSIFTGLNINVQKREKLVASYFVTNDDPDNKTFILHKNSDKSDDRAENLEWITYEQNRDLLCKEFLEEFNKNNPNIKYKEYHLNSFYIIFDDGRVFSKYICKFMKPRLIESNYYRIGIYLNNKNKNLFVHRIIAETFVENTKPSEYTLVDHIDRNSLNNHYTNLRWCNSSMNSLNRDFKSIINTYIHQYDILGNFIASYNSIYNAHILTKTNEEELRKCLKDKVSYAVSRKNGQNEKFIWKYDNISLKIKYEIPKDSVQIEGFTSYWITRDGKVYSELSKKFLKMHINNGYYTFKLKKDKKEYNFMLHRLVCEYFTPNKPENYKQLIVNHKSGYKLDCHIDNLEFISYKENAIHSIDVLGNVVKKVICHDIITGEILQFKSITIASRYFNITNSSMSTAIKRNKNKLYRKRYILNYDD